MPKQRYHIWHKKSGTYSRIKQVWLIKLSSIFHFPLYASPAFLNNLLHLWFHVPLPAHTMLCYDWLTDWLPRVTAICLEKKPHHYPQIARTTFKCSPCLWFVCAVHTVYTRWVANVKKRCTAARRHQTNNTAVRHHFELASQISHHRCLCTH